MLHYRVNFLFCIVGLLKETTKKKRQVGAVVNFLKKVIKNNNIFKKSCINMCIAGFFTRYLCVLVISVAYVSILALPFFYLLVLIFFGWFSDL